MTVRLVSRSQSVYRVGRSDNSKHQVMEASNKARRKDSQGDCATPGKRKVGQDHYQDKCPEIQF
ncbi:hypothetical protein EYF80_055783 [Liparis tanakae]|uniref:Uncharacterized protein n=1 Tax=Liparis tanakae TaxID=230148 RepID=A0A4Z2F081_9TELE|nr:hypothetical protein EYF80_055783 [Liparis tanakae]